MSGTSINDAEKERDSTKALKMGLFQEYFYEPEDYIKKPFAKIYRDLYYKYRWWE